MRKRPVAALAALAGLWLLAPPAARAEWPYRTEEASAVGAGEYSASAGFSVARNQSEALRGGRGTLWRAPRVEGTLGVGPWAEVAFEYDYLWFRRRSGGSARDSGDLHLWTKLTLPATGRFDLGLRFGMKLPNTSDEEGLGTDETDVFASLLGAAPLGPARLTWNAGLGILGDPDRNRSQDDVFTWAAALRAPLAGRWAGGLEATGFSGPFGVGRRRDAATVSAVVSWLGRRWSADLAGRRGWGDARAWELAAGVTFYSPGARRGSGP
ncbi:MAG: hypothetical protein Kow0092_08660 [Deferrisomatales bacterium]